MIGPAPDRGRSSSSLRLIFASLVVAAVGVHCAGDDGGGDASSAGTGGGAGCDAACDHIINECQLEAVDPATGEPLDLDGCISQCEGGSFGESTTCLANAECSLAAIAECAQGGGSADAASTTGASTTSNSTTTTTTTTTGPTNCGNPGDACSDAEPCCFTDEVPGICFNGTCCLGAGGDCSNDNFACCEGYGCESDDTNPGTCVSL